MVHYSRIFQNHILSYKYSPATLFPGTMIYIFQCFCILLGITNIQFSSIVIPIHLACKIYPLQRRAISKYTIPYTANIRRSSNLYKASALLKNRSLYFNKVFYNVTVIKLEQ